MNTQDITQDQITEARDWASDCKGLVGETVSAERAIAYVKREYPGGWDAFVAEVCVDALVPAAPAAPEIVRYAAGKTFTCTKRPFLPASDEQGAECGTEIVMHGFHWCAQVCPKCLANYFPSFGASMVMQLDTAGYYPADTAARVRKNIADNGGQYIPTF